MDYQKYLEAIRTDLNKYQSAMGEEAIWLSSQSVGAGACLIPGYVYLH